MSQGCSFEFLLEMAHILSPIFWRSGWGVWCKGLSLAKETLVIEVACREEHMKKSWDNQPGVRVQDKHFITWISGTRRFRSRVWWHVVPVPLGRIINALRQPCMEEDWNLGALETSLGETAESPVQSTCEFSYSMLIFCSASETSEGFIIIPTPQKINHLSWACLQHRHCVLSKINIGRMS